MFPTIFALGLKELGPNTKIGGSLVVMAIIGGAVLTSLMGLVSERLHSVSLAYTIPLVCYTVIAIYSLVSLPRLAGCRTETVKVGMRNITFE
jgi:FHS family L-fucose permease-like MFS transporter